MTDLTLPIVERLNDLARFPDHAGRTGNEARETIISLYEALEIALGYVMAIGDLGDVAVSDGNNGWRNAIEDAGICTAALSRARGERT